MWLKKIELKNFQNHSDLKLTFTSGVNVLHGATDVGKSCIRRAISWIFFNTPQGDVIRKEGTKKTSVKITLDNGIVVERIKSASINAYILVIGDEIKRFDSVGRSIPDEVLRALQTSLIDINGDTINLNISEQIAFPFLMDKSATFRSKLFNKLTGSEITDKILQDLNKDILKVNRQEKLITEDLSSQGQQLIELTEKANVLETSYANCKKEYDEILSKFKKYNSLVEIERKMNAVKQVYAITKDRLEKTKKEILSTDDLQTTRAKLEKLTELEIATKKNAVFIEKIRLSLKGVKDFSKIPFDKLRLTYEKLDTLFKLKDNVEVNKEKIKKLKSNKEQTKETANKWINKYKDELIKRDICPTCKQKITENTVKNIKIT